MTKRIDEVLTEPELHLLSWLSASDYSQYGECYGKALDGLIDKGLAQIHDDPALQQSFISKGNGLMYRAVSITDEGRFIATHYQDTVKH